MPNLKFRKTIDEMVSDNTLKEFPEEAFYVPVENDKAWYVKLLDEDIQYFIDSQVIKVIEKSEDMEKVFEIVTTINIYAKNYETKVFNDDLIKKCLEYCLKEKDLNSLSYICILGQKCELDQDFLEKVYDKIKGNLFYQCNVGYANSKSIIQDLGNINHDFNQCYDRMIIDDQIVKFIITFLTGFIDLRNGRYAKFKNYLNGIGSLCYSSKIIAKEFVDNKLQDLLLKIYSTLDREDIGTLWYIHDILLTLNKINLIDNDGKELIGKILNREGEYFGDYDDRRNFPVIIKNLKETLKN